jgi:hypothetical protein
LVLRTRSTFGLSTGLSFFISSEGSLIGDVITQRVSIAEGAFFKGLIDIHTPGQGNGGMMTPG